MKKILFLIVIIFFAFICLGVHTANAKNQSLSNLEKKFAEALERIDELEKRVSVNEDIEEIKRIQYHFITGHTTNDGEMETEVFADDATFMGQKGKEAITAFAKAHAEQLKAERSIYSGPFNLTPLPTDGHLLVHPIITVNGDKAHGTWMQYSITSDKVTMSLLYYIQAMYEVDYVKRDGKWQILNMIFKPLVQPRSDVTGSDSGDAGGPPPFQE
jgi:hypothetical protein